MSAQVDLLESVLQKTGDLMAAAPPDARNRPTPCGDFDVETLVGHLAEWCATFAAAAAGEPAPSVSGDAGSWPQPETAAFRVAAEHAVSAFRNGAEDGAVTLMGGPLPGTAVVGMMIMEYLAHGWDLAVGTGQPIPFDDAEAEAGLATGRMMLAPEYRGPDKSFGYEVPVPDDAPAVDRLIGFLGRDPQQAAA